MGHDCYPVWPWSRRINQQYRKVHLNLGPHRQQWAAQGGRLQKVRLLLDKGAKIKAADQEGYTALDLARNFKMKKAEESLLQEGALAEAGSAGLQKAKPAANPQEAKSAGQNKGTKR